MAKTLVTGANGFIGKRLSKALRASGHSVVEHTRKMADLCDAQAVLGLEPVDTLFHLAGRTFIPESWTHPGKFIETNVVGTTHVLEYCLKNRARLIFVSAYVYGIPDSLPISESHPTRANNPYALSKVMAEQVCEFYHEAHGLDVTVIRPFNVFGPGQDERFLIPKLISQIRQGSAIEVDDLSPRRDYIYVDDLVTALMSALKPSDRRFRVFNIGSGVSTSGAELVEIVQKIMGSNLRVISSDSTRRNEIPDTASDIAAAKAQLGWTPKLSLTDAIHRMIAEGAGT